MARFAARHSIARKHDHARCVEVALADAESICDQRGVRLTELRRRTLQLIWRAHRAVKAYDLLAQLGGSGKPVKPTTVYRALEFLLSEGLIHRVESMNAFVACSAPAESHESVLLLCEACGFVEEITVPELGRVITRCVSATDFVLSRAVVEVRGHCGPCRRAAVA